MLALVLIVFPRVCERMQQNEWLGERRQMKESINESEEPPPKRRWVCSDLEIEMFTEISRAPH